MAEAPSSVLFKLSPAARHISQGNSSLHVRFNTCRMNWLVFVGVCGLWGGAEGSRLLKIGDTLCPVSLSLCPVSLSLCLPRLPPASSQVRGRLPVPPPPTGGNLHPCPPPCPPTPPTPALFRPATAPPGLAGASFWRPQDSERLVPDPPKLELGSWPRVRPVLEAWRPPPSSPSSPAASLGASTPSLFHGGASESLCKKED